MSSNKENAVRLLTIMLAMSTLCFIIAACDENTDKIAYEKDGKIIEWVGVPEDTVKVDSTKLYPKSIYNISYSGVPSVDKVEIVIADSCEYIIGSSKGSGSGGLFLTHRGRCKFCEQRLKSLISNK